jgi:hypothetical protein
LGENSPNLVTLLTNVGLAWLFRGKYLRQFSLRNSLRTSAENRDLYYDHSFLRFRPFSAKKLAVFSKTNVMITFSKFRFVLSQKRQFFGENIQKIITSVLDFSRIFFRKANKFDALRSLIRNGRVSERVLEALLALCQ